MFTTVSTAGLPYSLLPGGSHCCCCSRGCETVTPAHSRMLRSGLSAHSSRASLRTFCLRSLSFPSQDFHLCCRVTASALPHPHTYNHWKEGNPQDFPTTDPLSKQTTLAPTALPQLPSVAPAPDCQRGGHGRNPPQCECGIGLLSLPLAPSSLAGPWGTHAPSHSN